MGPGSLVSNMSNYKCMNFKSTEPSSAVCNMPVCRTWGFNFDPGLVLYFCGDYEIISMTILLPSPDSVKKGCCQLQAKVCARCTGLRLVQARPGQKRC